MNKELYKLLMESGNLDSDFIKKAFILMMAEKPAVLPYVEELSIYNDENNLSFGSYSPEKKTIFVNKEGIINNGEGVATNRKVLALEVLKHELEHARFYEKMDQRRHDLESLLLLASHRDYALEHGLCYQDPYDREDYFAPYMQMRKQEYYDLDPSERIARINAWRYVVNLLKNQRRTQDLLDARINLYYAYIRGYQDNGCYLNPPTYEYLLKMGMYRDFYLIKNLVERQQYVFDTRLTYGLPLKDGNEYDAKILKKVLLQKNKRQ